MVAGNRRGTDRSRPAYVASHRIELLAVVTALVLRLPWIGAPPGPDEAGFLQVAAQWSPGGDSLYGDYWVDRPPLLITLYQLADLAGGLVPLRILGAVALAVAVLAAAGTAQLLAGTPASRWTAVITAALLVAPQLGSEEVNGELLAAPFVAVGILAVVAATRPQGSTLRLAAAGGAAGACAALVKQNILDVFVFVLALCLAGTVSVPGAGRHALRLLVGTALGATAAVAVAGAWALGHGTSAPGLFDAMYLFRVRAAGVVAEGGSAYALARARTLAQAWVTSGLAVMTAAFAVAARRWSRSPVMVALCATVVFDVCSAAAGGGYWRHYLVQLAVPLAIAVGALAARGHSVAVSSAVVSVALSVAAAVAGVGQVPAPSAADEVGAAIARAHRPGDTLTTLYGEPRVNFAAGLPSPYPYLWSLPTKTRDARLTRLSSLLRGPDAPTWVVVTHDVASWGLDTSDVAHLLSTRYHMVAECRGHTIYRHGRRTGAAPDCQEATTATPGP